MQTEKQMADEEEFRKDKNGLSLTKNGSNWLANAILRMQT